MKTTIDQPKTRRSVFRWLAVGTVVILLVPLISMSVSDNVYWSLGDFLLMGAMLFGFSSAFVLLCRWLPENKRIVVGIVFLAMFVYLWAEFAVGIFLNLGS